MRVVLWGSDALAARSAYSDDSGATWTEAAETYNLRSLTTDGTILVGVTNAGDTLTSTDGAAWTAHTTVLPWGSYNVSFINGTFVAVEDVDVTPDTATSVDGVSWTNHNNVLPSFNGGGGWIGRICKGGTRLLLTSDGTNTVSATSTDGVAWTTRTMPVAAFPQVLLWTGTYFLFVDSSGSGSAYTSPTGETWTTRTLPSTGVVGSGASDGAGNVVLLCSDSTDTYVSANNGETWSSGGAAPSTDGWNVGTWDGTKYIVGSNTAASVNNVVYSTTGASWSAATLSVEISWDCIAQLDLAVDPTFTVVGSSTAAADSLPPNSAEFVTTGSSTTTGLNPLRWGAFSVAGTSATSVVGEAAILQNGLDTSLPKITVAITGSLGRTSTLDGKLQLPVRAAFTGGDYTLAGTIPHFTASFTSLTGHIGAVGAVLPALEGSFSATAMMVGSVSSRLTRARASMSGAAAGSGTLAAPLQATTIVITASLGGVSTLDVVLPAVTFASVGLQQINATLDARLPRVSASFHATLTAAQVLTMVTNTITNAVVMYEQYPYNSFTKFNDMYLAAGPAGVYRVDVGDADDLVPISAYLSTGEIMFGSEFIKRISDFYAGMRSAGDITITVTADEQETYSYTLSPLDIAELKQRRSKIGKGMRGKYFKFTFANNNGADFDFDTMNVAAVATSRRV